MSIRVLMVIFSLFLSTAVLAKRGLHTHDVFSTIDFQKLSFHDAQILRKDIIWFLKKVEAKTKYESSQKSLFLKKLKSFSNRTETSYFI